MLVCSHQITRAPVVIGIQAEQRFVRRDRLLILTEHVVVAPQDEISLALARRLRQLVAGGTDGSCSSRAWPLFHQPSISDRNA